MEDKTPIDDAGLYLTVKGAATLMHVDEKTVLRWIRGKPEFRILARKVGRSYLFKRSSILAYLESLAVPPKPAVDAD